MVLSGQICLEFHELRYCPSPKTDNKLLEGEKKGRRKKTKAVNAFREQLFCILLDQD